MKLSFSTLACPAWSLDQVIDAAGRHGYDGIELRFLEDQDALWERPELRGAGLTRTRRRLSDAGLQVPCVDSRSFFHHPDPLRRRESLDEAERVVAVAHDLGARGVRVFGDKVQPGADRASTRAFIAESLTALAERARPAEVEVWLESHGDFARAADTLFVLEQVSGGGVGVLWDAPNAFDAGDDPAEGARRLGGAIRHVHLKDLRRRPGQLPEPMLPGEGEFPAAAALSALAQIGYEGWLSFEWEKKWHPQIPDADVALPRFVRWVATLQRGGDVPSPRARVLVRGRLEAEVHPDREATGRAAARVVADHLRERIATEGRAAAIFASAPSQNEFLTSLRAEPGLDWSKVTAFHLDEYVGVGPDHPASFRRFLQDRLFAHVRVAAFHGLEGRAPDLVKECGRYADLLRREAPSLAILGIGENGHLAFIDPPFCDFADPTDVRVVELDEVCRNQQVNDGGFPRLADVPRNGLSLTIPRLLAVPRAVAIVPGPRKRDAIAAALDGPVAAACPASILRRHPHATLFLDEASAAGVQGRSA
jgi:glucosamine-6-phosphate deaminase